MMTFHFSLDIFLAGSQRMSFINKNCVEYACFLRVVKKSLKKISERRTYTLDRYLSSVLISIAVFLTLNIFPQKSNQIEFRILTEHTH